MGIREELMSSGITKTTTKQLREFLLKDCNVNGQFELWDAELVKRFTVEKKSLGAGVYTVWLKSWNPYYVTDLASLRIKFEECKSRGIISGELYGIMIFRHMITPIQSNREYDSSQYDILHSVIFSQDYTNMYQTNYRIYKATQEQLKAMGAK